MVKCFILKGGFIGGCLLIFLLIYFILVNIFNKVSIFLSLCCFVYLKIIYDFECVYYKFYVGVF